MDALTNLGIEPWSLLLHLINIFSLVIVLTLVLYKPIFSFLEKRQMAIKASITEAENLKKEFEERITQMQKEQAAMRAEFEEQMSGGKKELDAKRAELIEEMEQKRTTMLEQAAKDINDRKTTLISEAEKEMVQAMEKIITHVIGTTIDQQTVEQSIEDEWKTFLSPHNS